MGYYNPILQFAPKDFGIAISGDNGVMGGNAEGNAQIALRILQDEKGASPDIVVANTALRQYAGRRRLLLGPAFPSKSARRFF